MNELTTTPETLPTVEEMLAAPESDYMSPPQLAFFRARLVAERDALLSSAKDTTLHLQDYQATPDPSDRATQEEDHTLELRVRDRERKLLHKIDEAIARIDDGTYGWCEESGEPIGIGRLLARPTATYSVEAQERHEARKKMHSG
jgi:DnaK suppressor protein